MDLNAYKYQIRELIPLHNSSDFNAQLDKILFNESSSDKFLIKMELNRLTSPCKRIIDLRDKTTETCVLFEKDKIKHYLTKKTIKVLEKNIDIYGLYSIGVFEAVHEYIIETKEIQQIQQTQKSLNKSRPVKKEQCEFFPLSQKNKRDAPRMFFVSDVLMTTSEGEKFTAQTSNISITGVKIKLKDDIHLNNNSLVTISFIGLALDYHDKIIKKQITYQLVKQENETGNISYFYLNFHDNENKTFIDFIRNFIELNKYKYKIDVHYYYQLAKIRALKNSYLAQMTTLPIFLNKNAPSPFLFCLENIGNKKLLQNWQCDGRDQLPLLFNTLRLAMFVDPMKNQQTTSIYTFTHETKGKQYFLCASEEELQEKGLKQLFINFGRSKKNWHVYHLTLIPFQYQASNDHDITESTPDMFDKVTHMATLQQLTKPYIFRMKQTPKHYEISQLNQFIHSTDEDNSSSQFVLFSAELRKEERYQYASNLSISFQGNHYNTKMVDFSTSGLKIKVNQISHFSNSNIVSVNLSDLQKTSKKHLLSDLQYKVVRSAANNILHLQVNDKNTLETCQSFFPLLVRNNAKHFTCLPLQQKKQPSQKQLIEIAEKSLLNAVFFISLKATHPIITFSAIDREDHPLHTLFSLQSDNINELNYYPLTNNAVYKRLVTEPFRKGGGKPVMKEALIYIKAVKEGLQWKITSLLDEDFKSKEAKLAFIAEAQWNTTFYVLHCRLSPLPKVDLQLIESEIRVISRFANHLTKKLEEELLSVEAMIELTDITADVANTANNRH